MGICDHCTGLKTLQSSILSLQASVLSVHGSIWAFKAFDINADQEPAFHSNADPEPASKIYADPEPCLWLLYLPSERSGMAGGDYLGEPPFECFQILAGHLLCKGLHTWTNPDIADYFYCRTV